MSRSEQIALAMDGPRQRLHLSGLSGFHEKGKLREKFAIFCSTASAIRLEKVSTHQVQNQYGNPNVPTTIQPPKKSQIHT
jgi:hypothetical protein